MKFKDTLTGKNSDIMPDGAFRAMKAFFKIYYFFRPAAKYMSRFGIQPGNTVVDMGCGPGAFIESASEKAGLQGLVYAVDVHEMAINSVREIVLRKRLPNVIPLLSVDNSVDIKPGSVDLTYALDMFHMVSQPYAFLKEIWRFSKNNAILIIEDGHQAHAEAKQKILDSGVWEIIEENKRFMRCRAI
jgi:ubiquinone/menaquinone biosynthesis C-methylase UbiE